MALLEVDALTKRFGGIVALDGASFDVEQGEILGLIGPNGAGKTTLFNCINRLYTPDEGVVRFDGRDLLTVPPSGIARAGIARTFQNLGLFPALSVVENVMVGAHTRTKAGFLASPLRLPWVAREEREVRHRAMSALEHLELGPLASHPAAGLSFGTLKRIELARAIAMEPKLVLLDEPASGLTHREVAELGGTIRALRDRLSLTVLLVEHHMAMVMGISDRVVALDFGRVIAAGSPADVASNPAVVEAYLGRPA